jgi:myo-inositol-1(or 4)-monophosphatase
MMSRADDLQRIEDALTAARQILARFTPGEIAHRTKQGGSPVTEADTAVNEKLLALLPRGEEGWLSEETADDAGRLDCRRVWVVDPVDGTKEFIQGIPEWSVSIGLVEFGRPVAGGICIPSRDLTVIGSLESGVLLNDQPCSTRQLHSLQGIEVLASRSEVGRGEWKRFEQAPFAVKPMGSVAAKLALVAAGLSDATWTLVPKHEWDVAAGAALVMAAGGKIWTPDGKVPLFNNESPRFEGFLAAPAGIADAIKEYLSAAIAEMKR